MRRRTLRLLLLAALATPTACIVAPLHGPNASGTWGPTLQLATDYLAQRRYDEAVRTLEQFAARFPGTPEAKETLYWRALALLDPANPQGSTRSATAAIDLYLASATRPAHRAEAEGLRRLVSRLDALAARLDLLGNAASGASSAAPDRGDRGNAGGGSLSAAERAAERASERANELSSAVKSRDAEIQKLKDDLAKANEELERIKRRLAAPKP